jgi:hypothetical protein
MVSCAVLSLTSLLKPIQWVSPCIPILPMKHIDFIDAPVPIVAGTIYIYILPVMIVNSEMYLYMFVGIVIDNEITSAIATNNYQPDMLTVNELLHRCMYDFNITSIL